MPIVTGASKSLPALNSSICEQLWLCSRLATSILVITTILAVLLLSCRTLSQRRPKQLVRVSGAGQDIARASGTPSSSIIVNLPAVLHYWVRLKQGQGHFEKRANRAVSRGGASGTALAGLGGSYEGGGMEEERRVSAAGSRSRDVSKNWTDEARRADGLLSHDQLLVTAEKSDQVGPAAEGSSASFHEDQDRMEDARYGGLVGISAGPDIGNIQDARGRKSTFFFGDYMADDEHILYRTTGLSHTGSAIGHQSSSHQNFPLDFSRSPPPRPFTPPASTAAESAPGLTAHREHLKSIQIPSRVATGSRSIWGNDGEVLGGRGSAVSRLEDGACPSSYPPTSPLLPPPPPTAPEAFDPAVVMFPGPARDGGVRIVSPHNPGEGGSSGTHGEVISHSDTPAAASWTRHTRVFGGGVCLACAAAAGDGGFYGDSVRPADKR